MKRSSITVRHNYSAQRIYQEHHRDEVLRVTQARKADGTVPSSAAEDMLERNIEEGARADIITTRADREEAVRNAHEKQAALEVDPDSPLNALDRMDQSAHQAFDDYKADNEGFCKARDAAATDLATTKAKHGLIRDPKENRFNDTLVNAAIGFAVESTLNVVILVSGGLPLFQSMSVAIPVAAVNVGIGGVVMGGWLLPYCLKDNSTGWHWPARGLQVLLGLIILSVNFLVWEFRAKHGFDPLSPTAEADAVFANLIGFGAFAIGILIAAFYFFLFARCRDLYLDYGELGERLEQAKSVVDLPAEDCRAEIRDLEEDFREALDEQSKAADKAVRESAQLCEAIKTQAQAFDTAQEGIVAVRQNVTELARQDARQILGIDTPAYYGTAPNYAHLLSPGLDVSEAEQRLKDHQDARDLLRTNIRDAKAKQQTMSKELFERIINEFGS